MRTPEVEENNKLLQGYVDKAEKAAIKRFAKDAIRRWYDQGGETIEDMMNDMLEERGIETIKFLEQL